MNIPEKIVNEWFNRLDKGYAVEPYTKRELRILHNVIKDNVELIRESMLNEKGNAPSATQWEYLITYEYNGGTIDSEDIKNVDKFLNTKYMDVAKLIADDLRKKLGIDGGKMSAVGSKNAELSDFWKQQGGTNKTPKTDLYLGDYRISLKQAGSSRYMSGKVNESIATYKAAFSKLSTKNDPSIKQFMDMMEEKMSIEIANSPGIRKLRKLNKSNVTDDELKSMLNILGQLDENKLKLTEEINRIFSNNSTFKKYFCFEAATGEQKFTETVPKANYVVVFDPKNKNIKKIINANTPEGVSDIANSSTISVEFKTSGAKSALTVQTKSNEGIKSIKEIIIDSYVQSGLDIISEEVITQMDENQILNKVYNTLKDAPKKVFNKVKTMLNSIVNGITKQFEKIKKMGKYVLNGIMDFFGIQIANVSVSSSGDIDVNDLL